MSQSDNRIISHEGVLQGVRNNVWEERTPVGEERHDTYPPIAKQLEGMLVYPRGRIHVRHAIWVAPRMAPRPKQEEGLCLAIGV